MKPEWRKRPSGDDIARTYPQRAKIEKVGGRVVIRCVAKANGVLEQCEVISEEPSGYGFGKAAIKLGASFAMEKFTTDGASVEGATVIIPLVFPAWR